MDVTSFLMDHPGGDKIILARAGTDATAAFEPIHKKSGGATLIKKWVPWAQVGFVPDLIVSAKEAEETLSSGSGNAGTALCSAVAQTVLNLIFFSVCCGSWFLLMGDK